MGVHLILESEGEYKRNLTVIHPEFPIRSWKGEIRFM
jgi:hypothetical protein